MIPYNVLPMEVLMPMVSAELGKVATYHGQAEMFVGVRKWIDDATTELNTRVGELSPQWTDEAGRVHEENTQRTLAELKMWGERIDAARPAETLTTLAAAITEAHATVTGLWEAYQVARLNPLGAAVAAGLQQTAGSVLTGLGGHFDTAMLTVAAASGIQSPGDVLPAMQGGASAEGNSPADFIKAAEAGITTLSGLVDLGSSVSSMGGANSGDLSSLSSLSDVSGQNGLSLAGMAPTLTAPTPVSGALLGGLTPGSGVPPVPTGTLGGFGAVGGLGGIPTLAKPVAGKRAPTLASEIQPATASPAAAKSAGSAMPPMMPAQGGVGAGGTLRPTTAEHPTGRSGSGRRPATAGSDGVPTKLRGRSVNGNPDAGFTLPRDRRAPETEFDSVQLLDEELWRSGTR